MQQDYGVDRLSIAFPVRAWDRSAEAWRSIDERRPGEVSGSVLWSGQVDVAGVPAFVGVMERRDGRAAIGPSVGKAGAQTWGKVEFNPSRIVDPDGAGLCPVVELRPAVEAAYVAALDKITPASTLDECQVRRLDTARDFRDVEHPGFFVRGLVAVKRNWARKSFIWNDPAKGLAETLSVGSGAGMVRLYDKHEHQPDKAPEGTLRWEAENRRGWTDRYGGITTVADLDAERIARLAVNRWEWSRMGVEVAGTDRVIDKVLRAGHTHTCVKGCELHYSEAVLKGFLGHLLMTARGFPTSESKATAAKYNRLARDLNITLTPDTFEGVTRGMTARLDWESGREVLRVA